MPLPDGIAGAGFFSGISATIASLVVVAMKVVHPGESGQAVGCDTHKRDRRIARMNIHKNARLTPPGRLLLVQRIEGGGWGSPRPR
jgi:hypothetical protein